MFLKRQNSTKDLARSNAKDQSQIIWNLPTQNTNVQSDVLCILGTGKPHHQLSEVEANAPAERRATASEPSSRSERTMMPPEEVRRAGRIRKNRVREEQFGQVAPNCCRQAFISTTHYSEKPQITSGQLDQILNKCLLGADTADTFLPPSRCWIWFPLSHNHKWLDDVQRVVKNTKWQKLSCRILIMVVAKLLIASRCLAQMVRLSWARNG